MKRLLSLIAAIALLGAGCATTTPDEQSARISAVAYAAASYGTQIALQQNPLWKPQFEIAYQDLTTLVNSKVVTGAALRQILTSLPVKELQSEQARIAIEGATFLYDALVGDKINIEQAPLVLAAAQGIQKGLGVALGH